MKTFQFIILFALLTLFINSIPTDEDNQQGKTTDPNTLKVECLAKCEASDVSCKAKCTASANPTAENIQDSKKCVEACYINKERDPTKVNQCIKDCNDKKSSISQVASQSASNSQSNSNSANGKSNAFILSTPYYLILFSTLCAFLIVY